MNTSGINFSESCGEIAAALSSAQFPYNVPKNKTAKVRMKPEGEYSYKYADLAKVLPIALSLLKQGKHAEIAKEFSSPIRPILHAADNSAVR